MPVRTTSRLLELLELLQARPLVGGAELAERLGVDRRTIRRDVATLQRLGIPVEAARGVGGGYRTRPGFRLPPLMLTEDEAVAAVLGLTAARRLGLGDPDGAERALAKLRRVLPDPLRRRVEVLEDVVAIAAPSAGAPAPSGATALLLAEAVHRGRRVRLTYRSHAGATSERELSPHGLVVHGGRWYLAAHDHAHDAPRTLRVDRVDHVALAEERALAPPAGFDAAAHVALSLARVPWGWDVEVLLALPLDTVRRRVPPSLAELHEHEDGQGTVLRVQAEDLEWAARLLAGLGCPLVVRRPDELREHLRTLAAGLAAC